MESRAFIRHAAELITKIETVADSTNHEAIQKELNMLFLGMHNPSLPSAARLAAVAQKAGFTVLQSALNKLEQAEEWWV